MKNDFTKALNFRHACKVFDDTKKISDEDIRFVLEAGRKSLSSFGMEAWKFLVIKNDKLKEKLKSLCWDQAQINSCSHLVLILTSINNVKPDTGIPKERLKRMNMPQDKLDFYLELYTNHLEETLSTDENIHHWTSKQTYLAAGNMMTAAAYIGIDSCPIEGFEKDKVEDALGLDKTQHQLAMVLPFGYRINKQSEQLRLNFDEVVEFIE